MARAARTDHTAALGAACRRKPTTISTHSLSAELQLLGAIPDEPAASNGTAMPAQQPTNVEARRAPNLPNSRGRLLLNESTHAQAAVRGHGDEPLHAPRRVVAVLPLHARPHNLQAIDGPGMGWGKSELALACCEQRLQQRQGLGVFA